MAGEGEPYWRAGAPERRALASLPRIAFREDRRRLRLGLLNNMPDTALAATERQFRTLFEAATAGRPVQLELFHVPQIMRGADAAARIRTRYRPASEIAHAGLDALVVTGAQPRADRLTEEPFWSALTGVADWAQAHGVPVLWSCLAAHLAVLHLDGVERRPLAEKCSGLFACTPTGDDPLSGVFTTPFVAPHSRSNGLEETELTARRYTILSRSAQAGVDAFLKRQASGGFLFLQGHPEYDQNSLALEFKRDLHLYLLGERAAPPAPPEGVFQAASLDRLTAMVARASQARDPELLTLWPPAGELALAPQTWREPAARLIGAWLADARDETLRAPLRRRA